MKHLLIIGGGVAACESAVSARKMRPDWKITMVSDEPILPYRRPALSKMVADDLIDPVKLLIHPESFYRDLQIDVRLNTCVSRIDAEEKCALTVADEKISYDELIIATGAGAWRPPVPGTDLPGVMSFRNYADLLKLRELLSGGLKNVVIVGAGLLGLELSESLLKRGCQVKMVDNQQQLLSRNLDAGGSEFFRRQLGKVENLSFHLGQSLQEILPGKAVLSDGTVLDNELVIFSAGTRPVFPVLSGAAPGVRLEVDLQMRTAFDHIFAAGDVAASPVPNPGLYLPARDMGQVAGTVAGGGDARFKMQESPVRFAAFGIKVFSCGQFSAAVRSTDLSSEGKYCREFYSADDRLLAVVLIGDVSAASSYLEKLKP